MPKIFDKHILKNGMVILGEPMEGVESVAFDFRIPAGAARLPDGVGGASSVIADWIMRGAGERDSRALIDAFDGLGIHRGSSVGSGHIVIGAVLEAGNLDKALELYADIILRPLLDSEQFALARELTLQELTSREDDPRGKVMQKLRERFYPFPLGRDILGNAEELNALTASRGSELVENLLIFPVRFSALRANITLLRSSDR